MADATKIDWCDSTFNPWIGCTRVSPACDDCYAARSTPARTRGIDWGAGQPRQRTGADNWAKPLKWNRTAFFACPTCGWRGDKPASFQCESTDDPVCPKCNGLVMEGRRRIFCASLSDWLDNEVPIEWLVDLLDLIRRTPNLDWLLLSKRIGNWQSRIAEAAEWKKQESLERLRSGIPCELGAWLVSWASGHPRANVWIGATVVNQQEADRDVPKLLQVPARVRFLSVEPMLGPVNLLQAWANGPRHVEDEAHPKPFRPLHGLDWVICGGESGPKARPMHPEWARSLRAYCAAAEIPFLFKQWGEWAPSPDGGLPDHLPNEIGKTSWYFTPPEHDWCKVWRFGKKAAGNLLDGRQHLEWPEAQP